MKRPNALTKLTFAACTLLGSIGLAQESILSEPVESRLDLINTLQQREWVSLNADGALTGKVNAFGTDSELMGRLQRNGVVVARRQASCTNHYGFVGRIHV